MNWSTVIDSGFFVWDCSLFKILAQPSLVPRAHDPWRRPEGSWALGTRLVNKYKPVTCLTNQIDIADLTITKITILIHPKPHIHEKNLCKKKRPYEAKDVQSIIIQVMELYMQNVVPHLLTGCPILFTRSVIEAIFAVKRDLGFYFFVIPADFKIFSRAREHDF